MTSKMGCHIIGWTEAEALLNFIGRVKPRVIKVVAPGGHDGMKIAEAKRRSPDSLWLLRRYVDHQPLDDPLKNAAQFAAKILSQPGMDECYDIFEDYNEIDPRDHSQDPPGPLDIEIIKRYNDFSAEFSRIVATWGKQTVTGCWSNGQPPNEAWRYMKDCVEWANYVSLHGYGWPTMSSCEIFTLRYRQIYHKLLPFERPLILSEMGMTDAVFGGKDLGWKSWDQPLNFGAKERQAAAEFAWLLDRVNEDPFVFSVHPYTTGRLHGDNWGTHDFTKGLYYLVGNYAVGHPSPPEGEEPMPRIDLPRPDDAKIPGLIDLRASIQRNPESYYIRRDLAKVDTIVIHHIGVDAKVTPEGLARYHVGSLKWPGPGYHAYIRKDGSAYWLNSLEVQSWHCGNHNEHTVGICFEGSFIEGRLPTDQQYQAGLKLIAGLDEIFDGRLPLRGHNQMSGHESNLCPGAFDLAKLRASEPSERELRLEKAAINARKLLDDALK